MSEYQTQTLRCVTCGSEFVWDIQEQEWFHEKGYHTAPRRCKRCRVRRHFDNDTIIKPANAGSTNKEESIVPSIVPPGTVLMVCNSCSECVSVMTPPVPYGTVFLCRHCKPKDDGDA